MFASHKHKLETYLIMYILSVFASPDTIGKNYSIKTAVHKLKIKIYYQHGILECDGFICSYTFNNKLKETTVSFVLL